MVIADTREIPVVRINKKKEENNGVDNPVHYNRENAMECIDEMVLVFGKKATRKFCLLNAWKYRYRAGQKDSESAMKDLKKSDWYLRKYAELGGKKAWKTQK